ncbi:hypothetical protein A5786_01160 [Gordonia sp. 852002-50816_SCH5313054-a]|nr:hypothetical protein A5786_01160 [Gordonia sp. 852002-50816_SCH5313054-a]
MSAVAGGLRIVATLVPAATPTAPLVLFAGRLGTLLRRGLLLRGRILPAGLTPGGLLGRSFLRGSLLGRRLLGRNFLGWCLLLLGCLHRTFGGRRGRSRLA